MQANLNKRWAAAHKQQLLQSSCNLFKQLSKILVTVAQMFWQKQTWESGQKISKHKLAKQWIQKESENGQKGSWRMLTAFFKYLLEKTSGHTLKLPQNWQMFEKIVSGGKDVMGLEILWMINNIY